MEENMVVMSDSTPMKTARTALQSARTALLSARTVYEQSPDKKMKIQQEENSSNSSLSSCNDSFLEKISSAGGHVLYDMIFTKLNQPRDLSSVLRTCKEWRVKGCLYLNFATHEYPILQWMCQVQDNQKLDILLQNPSIDQNIQLRKRALRIACQVRYLYGIDRLLPSPSPPPHDSSSNSSTSTSTTTTTSSTCDGMVTTRQRESRYLLLKESCSNGNISVVNKLLTCRPVLGYTSVEIFKAFLCACRTGQEQMVDRLLKDPIGLDASAWNNKAIRVACAYGHLSLVKRLLLEGDGEERDIDLSAKGNECFRNACQLNRLDVVDFLVDHPNVNPVDVSYDALDRACTSGHEDVVKLLLNRVTFTSLVSRSISLTLDHYKRIMLNCFKRACAANQVKIVDIMLEHPQFIIDPVHVADGNPILSALTPDCIDVLDRLLKEPRFPIPDDEKLAQCFNYACKEGWLQVVQRLLSLSQTMSRVSANNAALTGACTNNHLAVVKALVADGRVILYGETNQAIRIACEKGHLELVELLSNDPRVNPLEGLRSGLVQAAGNGHLDIVKHITLVRGNHPNFGSQAALALNLACRKGNLDMVEWLLQLKHIDPSNNNNYALQDACRSGNVDIVKLLLAHPKLKTSSSTPLTNLDKLIRITTEHKHYHLTRLLLDHHVPLP